MFNATLGQQLVITVKDEVGALAEVTSVIATAGINLIAVCAHAVDNKGVIMFVSENNEQARRLLNAKGYEVREEEVVLVSIENKPGTLQALTKKIAEEGINLTLIYGSVDKKAKASPVVLISEDNQACLTSIKIA